MRLQQSLHLAFLAFLLSCCHTNNSSNLRIATASNMQYAMKDLVKVFEENTGIQTELIIGSSGKLTAQIIEGAPYDILVSADMKYPNELHQRAKTKNKPRVYAAGKLVLWTLSETTTPSLKTLTESRIKHIAAANPMTAPYGKAATDIINQLNDSEEIQAKLVYGESISQVNQFIISQAAEIGFTSLSTVLSPQAVGKGIWKEMNDSLYTPIDQGVVMIDRKKATHKSAEDFYAFLFSAEAKTILKDFGYSIYE